MSKDASGRWPGMWKAVHFLILIFLLSFYQVVAQDTSNSTVSTWTTDSGAPSTTLFTDNTSPTSTTNSGSDDGTSVGLAAALSAASTASAQQSQLISAPPIPLPTDDPQYRQLLELAPGMPPLQRTTDDSTAPDGAAAVNGTLASRSEEELQQLLDAHRPPRLAVPFKRLDKRAGPLRVLCVGDSMSQGQQGDWSWRYRMWQWFNSNSIAVNFVGPWVGTVKPPAAGPQVPPPIYGSSPPSSSGSFDGGYAIGVDSGWSNARHFSAWGRAAAVDQFLIKDVVHDYQPDLILLMLGFNDLGWFYSDPSGTLNSVYNLMQNARLSNPNVAFAIANIPQRSSLNRRDLPANTETYNKMLANAIPNWNTGQSPITLVKLRENYQCDVNGCPAGYDGLHPNAMGEYQIAQAFSQSLHGNWGFGTGPISIPANIPARNLPQPTNFKVFSSPSGVTATWDAIYGAYGYEVMSRIDGVTDFTSGTVQANRYDQHWPVANASYSMYVRAVAGNQVGPWSQTLSAVAHPQTAPAPSNVFVNPTDTGVTITWDKPTGPYTDSIYLYNVITWDLDTDCDFIVGNGFQNSPAVITGLNVGHRYLIAIETWNANGEGFPMVAHNVVPGFGRPNVPTGFNLISSDPTSVYATWDKMANAGGYNVYVRDNATNGTFSNNGGQGETCFTDYFLFPGVWNFQFCVSAYNGNLESYVAPWPCPYAPSPVSSMNPQPTCPGPKAWCSGGGQPWGPAPEDPGSIGPAPGDHMTTITTTVNGAVTTLTETVKTLETTDSSGHIVTVVVVEPASVTGPPPSGASLITSTRVGTDGTTTLLIETVFPYIATDSKGSQTTRTSTQVGAFPTGGGPSVTNTVVTTTDAQGHSTTFTETLRPTTATYSGTTYTGTITQKPVNPTTTSGSGFIYATTFPSGSGVSYSYTSVTTNTHDPYGHPVLGPWPLCWFCAPGTNGIVLFGFSLGTIFPPGGPPPGPPGPPGFTASFPTVTIDSQGNPSYQSSPDPSRPTTVSQRPSTSQQSSCTTHTASNCEVFCSSTANQASPTCSTTCATTVGCSATGSTTTTTKTCTGSHPKATFSSGIIPSTATDAAPTNPPGTYDGQGTPIGPYTGQWAINVYSDPYCSSGSFVRGYYGGNVTRCINLPTTALSWQFVSSSYFCGSTTACSSDAFLFSDTGYCNHPSSYVKGQGCGDVKTCQNSCRTQPDGTPLCDRIGAITGGDQCPNSSGRKRELTESGGHIVDTSEIAQKQQEKSRLAPKISQSNQNRTIGVPNALEARASNYRTRCGSGRCSGRGCKGKSRKRALLSEEHNSGNASLGTYNNLSPRALGSCDNIVTYLYNNQALGSGNGFINLEPDINGGDVSFTTLQRFGNNAFRIGLGLEENDEGEIDLSVLSGCLVVTVISNQAVYMGHFWETLALNNDPDPSDPNGAQDDEPADFLSNCLDLISGSAPHNEYAAGDAINPSLFQSGNPTAYIYTLGNTNPPVGQHWPPSANWGDATYPHEINQLQDLLYKLIPNLRIETLYYQSNGNNGADTLDPDNTAYFEYDPIGDSDGNQWRLFYGGLMVRQIDQYGPR